MSEHPDSNEEILIRLSVLQIRIEAIEDYLEKENIKKCPHCWGYGVKKYQTDENCPECYGTGQIQPEEAN